MSSPPPWSCARGWCRRRPAATPALTPDARRMLEAIDGLPEDEREAFDLVRIQGLTQAEAAEVLGRLGQDGAAAAEPRPACCWRSSWPTSARQRTRPAGPPEPSTMPAGATSAEGLAMTDDPRASSCSRSSSTRAGTPGGGLPRRARSCCPRSASGWRQSAGVEAEVDALFPPAPPAPARGRPRPAAGRAACRGSPATRWRRCSAAAAWASSTGRGTCASTAPSP